MEKLQAAIERARKTRQDQAPEQLGRRQPAPRQPTSVDALWQELPEFEVDKRQLESNRLVTRVANAKATPFDILRTKILLQMRQNGWKRLAITSPMPKSGKTTTACNLAFGFGRQNDLRTMVLDLDLRAPSISDILDVVPQHGIGDVFTGKASFPEQAMRYGSNVAFSMAKQAETDPTRLLLAEETASVIDEIEEAYQPDIMIFDLPSMLVNDDTRAFLKNVDCALIVLWANRTRYRQFDLCEQEIAEHTNVLGVILNAYRYTDATSSR